MSEDTKPIRFHSRFMVLPTRILRDVAEGRLDPLGLAILGALSSHVPEDGEGDEWVYCGLERIGRMVGKSKATAQRAVEKLIRLGFVERELKGRVGGGKGRGRTLYRVVLDGTGSGYVEGVRDPGGDEAGAQVSDMGFEGEAQVSGMGFEGVDNSDPEKAQVSKRGLKSQKGGSSLTLDETEIRNGNLNTRARVPAREGCGFDPPIEAMALIRREAILEAGETVTSKWLSGAVWRDGAVIVPSGLAADRVRLEFPRALQRVGKALGLDGSVQVKVKGG